MELQVKLVYWTRQSDQLSLLHSIVCTRWLPPLRVPHHNHLCPTTEKDNDSGARSKNMVGRILKWGGGWGGLGEIQRAIQPHLGSRVLLLSAVLLPATCWAASARSGGRAGWRSPISIWSSPISRQLAMCLIWRSLKPVYVHTCCQGTAKAITRHNPSVSP